MHPLVANVRPRAAARTSRNVTNRLSKATHVIACVGQSLSPLWRLARGEVLNPHSLQQP